MIYKNLYINLIIRMIILTISCFTFAMTFYELRDWIIMANILIVIILQIFLLIRYLNKLNQDLYNFFSAVRNDDSSIIYERMAPSKSFVPLYKSFDEVNLKIRNLRVETVNKNLYLQNLIEHVGIGLISFDTNGTIEIINTAARKLLNIPAIKKIDRLARIEPSLPEKLKSISPGSQLLLNLKIENELLKIAVKASLFRIEHKEIRLLSFQNIKSELEENELISYQKLIRILTHEIMNSTGPILSSISTIKDFLTDKKSGKTKKIKAISQELLDDSVNGLNIIEERSSGLTDFVGKFRSLTLLPKPVFSEISVRELLYDIEILMKAEFKNNKIKLSTEITPTGITIHADKKLVEQIIINLITNSIQALEKKIDRNILLKAFRKADDKNVIQVIDNGTGIPEEELENIFVPFYTTKERGSGIGLSLSRQIMRLHNGKISMSSNPGIETIATLEF